MAGTGAATSNDYEAVYANPAGLAELDDTGKRATVGFMAADFRLRMNGVDTNTAAASGIVLGGAVPIPLGGWAKDRFGLGFGFYVPNDAIARVSSPFVGQPTFALLENRAHVIGIQVGLGMKVTPRFSVGVSVVSLAALTGSIDINTDAGGHFTTSSEQNLVTQFAPIIGARWTPRRRLGRDPITLGIVARGESRSDYDLTINSNLGNALPLTLPQIRIAGVAQYDPATVAGEAAWKHGQLTSVLQVAYQRWSAYPLPTENPTAPPNGATLPQQPPNFHDTVVPRVALEWKHVAKNGHSSFAGRLGYAFLWSPAPEATGQQSLLDNNRHEISAGLGIVLHGPIPIHLDAFAQLHLLIPRTNTKDPGELPAGDIPAFTTMQTTGTIIVVGASLGIEL